MKSDDEKVYLNINENRLRKITDKDIKAKARQIRKINIRMIRIKFSTDKDEYLVTNIPYEKMDTNEIGRLYFKR